MSEPYPALDVKYELAEMRKAESGHTGLSCHIKTTVSAGKKHLTLYKRAVKPCVAFETADTHKLHPHKRVHGREKEKKTQ
jgi:hypothetical protein